MTLTRKEAAEATGGEVSQEMKARLPQYLLKNLAEAKPPVGGWPVSYSS